MINSALAYEIYRGIWAVENAAVTSLKNTLMNARSNASSNEIDRANTFCYAFSDDVSATVSMEEAANSTKTQKRISVTNVNGVITKSGGSSSRGMKELSSYLVMADNDPNVIGHMIVVDSPGGSVSGMDYMKTTIKSLKKPVVTMVERQGVAASGGYGILSEGDYVFAESGDAEVGSIGVVCSVSGIPNGERDGNNELHFTVYSTKSPDKNSATEKAINEGDTSLLEARADALAVSFHESTRAVRPNIKDEQMTGAMYAAKDVVGTMVDAIGTKTDAMNKILELSKTNNRFSANNKNKTKAMTAQEIQSQYPEAYKAIYGAGETAGQTAGVNTERERVKVWQTYAEVDPEMVNKGISEGREMSNSERETLLFKSASSSKLKVIQGANAKDIVAPEGTMKEIEPTADEIEAASIYGKYLKPTN